MSIFDRIKKKFNKSKYEESDGVAMISIRTGAFFSYKNNIYESDVIRTAIRPKIRAIGKAVAHHVSKDQKTGKKTVDNDPRIKRLLKEPNQFMTGQIFQEKMITQLELNNNAFAYVEKFQGYVIAMYPINCTFFEIKKDDKDEIYIIFTMPDGKRWTAKYSNILHLKKDISTHIFLGESHSKTLTDLLEVVTTTDQGIVNAIKNSNFIRWLLRFNVSLKPRDLEEKAKEFAKTYTATESTTGGVAAIGSDAQAQQIENKEYVPNATQNQNTIKRIYAYFNTNENIVNSKYTEDEWISYYENVIEPDIIQFSNELTRKIFTLNERSYGNEIKLLSSNLSFASMQTKLNLIQFVDRGVMSPNEVRDILGFTPVDGGDVMIRRLDTRPTNE